MLDIDITLVIQLVNFLVTLVFLNYLLIKPVRNIMAQRKGILASFANEAEKFNTEAEKRLRNYESALQEARTKAGQEREAIRSEGARREQEIVSQAQTRAQGIVQKSKEQISAESAVAMQALRGQADALASAALKKILA